MKMREVVLRAIAGKITWNQAADVLGISDSAMQRLRQLYRRRGYDGFWDRACKRQNHNVPLATVEQVFLLYQQKYPHLSVRSFYPKLAKRHGIHLSYEWVSQALHEAGLVVTQESGRQPRVRIQRDT
jgi:transposase